MGAYLVKSPLTFGLASPELVAGACASSDVMFPDVAQPAGWGAQETKNKLRDMGDRSLSIAKVSRTHAMCSRRSGRVW